MINSKCAMMHALDAEACTVLSAHMHYMMIWLLKSASKPKQAVITVFSIKEVKSRFFSSISPLISCALFPSLFSHSPTNQTLRLSLFLFWPSLILLPFYLFSPATSHLSLALFLSSSLLSFFLSSLSAAPLSLPSPLPPFPVSLSLPPNMSLSLTSLAVSKPSRRAEWGR